MFYLNRTIYLDKTVYMSGTTLQSYYNPWAVPTRLGANATGPLLHSVFLSLS